MQTIDHIVVRRPQLAGRAVGIKLIYLRAIRHQGVVVGGLHRARSDDRDRRSDGSNALDRQGRQVALALLPDGGHVNLPGSRRRQCRDLALGRVEEDEALARLVDAVDQAIAI